MGYILIKQWSMLPREQDQSIIHDGLQKMGEFNSSILFEIRMEI